MMTRCCKYSKFDWMFVPLHTPLIPSKNQKKSQENQGALSLFLPSIPSLKRAIDWNNKLINSKSSRKKVTFLPDHSLPDKPNNTRTVVTAKGRQEWGTGEWKKSKGRTAFFSSSQNSLKRWWGSNLSTSEGRTRLQALHLGQLQGRNAQPHGATGDTFAPWGWANLSYGLFPLTEPSGLTVAIAEYISQSRLQKLNVIHKT